MFISELQLICVCSFSFPIICVYSFAFLQSLNNIRCSFSFLHLVFCIRFYSFMVNKHWYWPLFILLLVGYPSFYYLLYNTWCCYLSMPLIITRRRLSSLVFSPAWLDVFHSLFIEISLYSHSAKNTHLHRELHRGDFRKKWVSAGSLLK